MVLNRKPPGNSRNMLGYITRFCPCEAAHARAVSAGFLPSCEDTMLELISNIHWAAVLQIIVIDILLGGDNAVVIALACRRLPPRQRMQGVLWGTAGAVAMRLVFVGFAVYLQMLGGLLLLWIGTRLLLPEADAAETIKPAERLLGAIKTIIFADLVMSIDNVIAIAGAAETADAEHRIALVAFGLIVSIPLVVWGSQLVLKLIDRFPVVVGAGAGLLGWIAGGLIVSDPALAGWSRVSGLPHAHALAGVAGAALVVGLGSLLKRRRVRAQG
jgi:YjbE family integral membrane protein